MSEVINRYDRQERIEGWNQNKLKEAKVAIVGAGHVGGFLATSLAALGVGNIGIYDNEKINYTDNDYGKREFWLSKERNGVSKAEALEEKVRKVNPLVDVFGIHMSLDKITESLLEKPDIMVIATNNIRVIDRYNDYAYNNDFPVYIVTADKDKAFFTESVNDSEILDYFRKEEEAINSEIISGLVSGEVVKYLMTYDGKESLSYNPSAYRFDAKGQVNLVPLTGKKALVVGAGALGNFLGIGLAHAGLEQVYLVDDDTVDQTNLNRQVMFYDSVGKPKAEALATKLMEINPDIKVEPIRRRVTETFERTFKQIKPDVLIDCVDNLSTRAILNYFAVKHTTPLISGGTNYQRGQLAVYEPGKSSCLDCRLDVDKALAKARQSSSCIYAPTPSVIITNHIIGGLMAAETRCVLSPENYGNAVTQMIKYDSTKPPRIGVFGAGGACECKRRMSGKKWIKGLMSEAA